MQYRPALVVLSPYLFGILVARQIGYVPVFWLWLPGLLLLLAGLTVNSLKKDLICSTAYCFYRSVVVVGFGFLFT